MAYRTKTEDESVGMVVGATVIMTPILLILSGLFAALFTIPYALAFQQLWAWYAVPIFKVSPLSTGAAYGLSLIVSLLTYRVLPETDETGGHLVYRQIICSVSIPVSCLIAGWLMRGYV